MSDPVRTLIAETGVLQGAELVGRLGGGQVSDSWLLQLGEQQLVLRLDQPLARTLGLDRQAESRVLQVVGEAGIGPQLVWADPARGIQVSTYIPGSSWTPEDMHDPALLIELAHTLKQLHSLPASAPLFDPAAAARRYAGEIGQPRADRLAQFAGQLAERLYADTAQAVLCHNDLVHGNIVGCGPVRLIDWEYAAMGDPYFDLAVVLRHHTVPGKSAGVFLNAYAGKSQQIDYARLEEFYVLYDLLAGLWYLSMVLQSGPASPFGAEWERVKLRLKKCGLDPGA